MSRMLLAAMISTVALPGLGAAQQPHDCEWLLRYGIYDTQDVAIDRYTIEHLRFLLSRSKAGSIREFQIEAGAAGLNILGLFDLNLGGRRAKDNFGEWRQAFLNTATHDLLHDDRLRIVSRQISPVLIEAVKKCLDNPRPGTLVGWVQPSKDDLTFTLKLKYNRIGDENAIIKSVTVVSSPPGNIAPLGEAQEKLIKEGTAVSTVGEGTAIVFQRTKPSTAVTLVVNTDKGSKTLEVPAVDPNETINRLNRKIADLESKKVGVLLSFECRDGKVEVRSQDNVRQVLRTEAGKYQVQFSTPFANSKYVPVVSSTGGIAIISVNTPNSLEIHVTDVTGKPVNSGEVFLLVAGELTKTPQ